MFKQPTKVSIAIQVGVICHKCRKEQKLVTFSTLPFWPPAVDCSKLYLHKLIKGKCCLWHLLSGFP